MKRPGITNIGESSEWNFRVQTREQVLAQLQSCLDQVEEIRQAKEQLKNIAISAVKKGKVVGYRNHKKMVDQAIKKLTERWATMSFSESFEEAAGQDLFLKAMSKMFKFLGL